MCWGCAECAMFKARYTPRHQGGLGLCHFTFSLCMATVHTAIRYLNRDGPTSTNEVFAEAMLSTTRNAIQYTVMDACHAIGLRYHSTGLWASCPPSLFLPNEKVQVRFQAAKPAPHYSKFGNRLKRRPRDLGFHLGTVTEVQKESATLQFPDGTTHTIKDPSLHRNEKEYTFQNPAIAIRPLLVGRHELLSAPPSSPARVHPEPPPPPGRTEGSASAPRCTGTCTGFPMSLTPSTLMTSKSGAAPRPLPSSNHPHPKPSGYTSMAPPALWAMGQLPPYSSRVAPGGSCAKHPRTRPQRGRNSGRQSCCCDGPSNPTHTSPSPY